MTPISLEERRRAKERRDDLVAALEELAFVVDLALSRVRFRQQWSGTRLVIHDLPALAAMARSAADQLTAEFLPSRHRREPQNADE